MKNITTHPFLTASYSDSVVLASKGNNMDIFIDMKSANALDTMVSAHLMS